MFPYDIIIGMYVCKITMISSIGCSDNTLVQRKEKVTVAERGKLNEVVVCLSLEKKGEGIVIKGNQNVICVVGINNIRVL